MTNETNTQATATETELSWETPEDPHTECVSEDGGDEMTNETTTQATETETQAFAAKPKKESKPKRPYPFRTKRDILAQIEVDDDFVFETMGILYQRQTSDERDTKTTKYRNARGFMSSHAVNGTRLVEKVLHGGEVWDEADMAQARSIACRYGKQLAAHFRAEVLESSPELAAEVACFFKPQA